MKEIVVQKKWRIWDINFLEQIPGEVARLDTGTPVCVNFSEIDEMNGERMPVVLVLTHLIYGKTKKQLSFSNVNAEVRDYLMDMKFFQLNYVRTHTLWDSKEAKRDVESNIRCLIPVYRICNENSIRDFFRRSDRILDEGGVEQELYWGIRLILRELMYNGQEHSVDNSSDLYVYAFGANEEDRINLMVIDFGMGFYRSLSQGSGQEQVKDHMDAIVQVLERNLSKRHTRGGGGYVTIKKIMRECNGQFLIVSGDAAVIHGADRIEVKRKLSMEIIGSLIFIQLKKGT